MMNEQVDEADIHFYGLLFISTSNVNFQNVKSNDALTVYVKNAVILGRTLAAKGSKLKLLTNNKKYIMSHVPEAVEYVEIVEINFGLNIPEGSKFYSAHFKIDVFRYFSKLAVKYCGLLDLDVLCLNDFEQKLRCYADAGSPIVYDITNQLTEAYGADVYRRDLLLCTNREVNSPKWFGGEFIFGEPEFFRKLIIEIDAVLPNYINNLDKMNHVGDEAVTSAALNNLIDDGCPLVIVNKDKLIYRYWSNRPRHVQISLNEALEYSFLHLPSDKLFLAANFDTPVSELKLEYYKYCYSVVKRLANLYRLFKLKFI